MSAAPLSPISALARKIAKHLVEHPGVVGWEDVRELAGREEGVNLFDPSKALHELRVFHQVDYCHSCRSFLSPTTTHTGGCPRGG